MNENKIQIIKDDEIGVRTLLLAKLNNGEHISILALLILSRYLAVYCNK